MLRFLFIVAFSITPASAGDWPRFRGPNGTGLPENDHPLPSEIGPDKNVVWKTALAAGHSSPVIVGDHIFLTTMHEKKLATVALDRSSGKIVWEKLAPNERLEEVHRVGSLATATPAADRERVVSFFGSYGAICYDHAGNELWRVPLGPFKNDFGCGSSPILVDDLVVFCLDNDTEACMLALDKATGKKVWETARPEASRNFCVPAVWQNGPTRTLVTAGTLQVSGYDLRSGAELWNVNGVARMVCMSPVVSGQRLIAAGWSAGGDEGERTVIEPYETTVREYDADRDGAFTEEELPKGPVKQRFTQADRDKDGFISRAEYDRFRRLFDLSENSMIMLERSDSSDPRTAWRFGKFVPFCSTPIVVGKTVFGCKDGGILASLDLETGKLHKAARVPGTDDYYASLVAGDGKIFAVNEIGKLSIVSAEPEWKVLSSAELGENVYATPAIADGRLYVRSVGHLWCFGE